MDELKQYALESCNFRGHEMGEWHDFSYDQSSCECLNCNKGVWIIINPLPNEIDISGEAVALNCND